MELHKTIKNIILTDGQDILKEMRLVNILDDFNAYQDIPASKYILRAIIADGYTNKLLAIGKWDNAAEALSQKFSAVTGFIPESVSLIFQSIAYGLGWVNSISQSPGGNKQNNQTQSQAGTPLSSRPTCSCKDSELETEIYSESRLSSENNQLELNYIDGVSLGITSISKDLGAENNELNSKLKIVPLWNDQYNIIFNELNFTNEKDNSGLYPIIDCFEWQRRYWLKFDISYAKNYKSKQNIGTEDIEIFLFIVCANYKIHSKHRLTSICIKDKYSQSSGIIALDIDFPICEIESIIIIPEIEEPLYFPPRSSNTPPIEIILENRGLAYERLGCQVISDLTQSSFNMPFVIHGLSTWGFKKSIALSFVVEGKYNFVSRLFLEERISVAFFDTNGRCIDTIWFTIEKTGFLYFKYFELNIDVLLISKIIISQSN